MVVIPCRNNFDQAFIQNLNAHIGYRDQTFKIKNQHKSRKSNINNKSFCTYDSYSWPKGWTKRGERKPMAEKKNYYFFKNLVFLLKNFNFLNLFHMYLS